MNPLKKGVEGWQSDLQESYNDIKAPPGNDKLLHIQLTFESTRQ